MIEFRNVRRTYGNKTAVHGLDLRVPPGEVFGLLGHNGAGKTTSIKMLVGLLQPDSGAVSVCGIDVSQDPIAASARVGYVPDQPFLYDKLTGREFLRFVGEMNGLGAAEVADAISAEVARFGLTGFVDQLTESYSHGMKQRTVFASALLHRPEAIVVDEPLVGLDPQTIRLVKDLLRSAADAGATVLMSTHTLGAAEEICDRIGVMDRGRLIFEGDVADLRERAGSAAPDDGRPSLEAAYLSLLGPGGIEPSDVDTGGGTVEKTPLPK